MEPTPGGVPYDYDEIWDTVYGDIQEHGPVHRHSRRITSRLLKGVPYRSVLDVGCGPAVNYPLLSAGSTLDDFSGIDISTKALQRAREIVPDGHFMEGDIQVEHPDGKWDLVSCSFVLEHLPDDVGALNNMRKVTRGHLLVATIAGDFERYRAREQQVGHVRNYKRGELEQKLASAGFTVEQTIYWGYPLYSPLVRRLQNRGDFGLGSYSRFTRVVADVTYWMFWLNSRRKGDVVIALASPST